MMDNCDENSRIQRESKTNFWNICFSNGENTKITIESLKQAVVEVEKIKKYISYTLPYSGYFSRETVYFEPVEIPFFIDIDKINKEPVRGLKANDIIVDDKQDLFISPEAIKELTEWGKESCVTK